MNDLEKTEILESVLQPDVPFPKIESPQYTQKKDLLRNYNTTKKIVNAPGSGVLITQIKAADGSQATLVRDDETLLEGVRKSRKNRKRNQSQIVQSSKFSNATPAVSNFKFRKRLDLLNDPAVVRDVSELVRDNDEIMADYISQLKYGRNAKEAAFSLKIKHMIETAKKKPERVKII